MQSVVFQTYESIGIVIIDDCSSDKTDEIISDFLSRNSFTNIYYQKNISNLGMAGNWNKVLKLAKGKYIKFLFGNDLLEKTCVEKMVQIFENSDVYIVFLRSEIFCMNQIIV